MFGERRDFLGNARGSGGKKENKGERTGRKALTSFYFRSNDQTGGGKNRSIV